MAKRGTETRRQERYVAFLRAINVGGRTVKMEQLRALFEALGFANVATFIASGNVIFETSPTAAAELEQRIEGHLHKQLGYEVPTFVRSCAALAAVATHDPLPDEAWQDAVHALYVMFVRHPPEAAAAAAVHALSTDNDQLHVHGSEVYWMCRTRLSDATITGAQLERAVQLPGTIRNVTTVRKLAAKYPAGSA